MVDVIVEISRLWGVCRYSYGCGILIRLDFFIIIIILMREGPGIFVVCGW